MRLGIERLGWDEQGNTALLPGRLIGWVDRARSERAGSVELGHLVRPGENRWFMDEKETDLPDAVDYATGRLTCLFPGLVVFSMQFVLNDETALSLDRVLREEYETLLEPRHRATAHLTPGFRKHQAVQEKRAELRRACASWFSDNAPGVFHGGVSSGRDFPSCELLTVQRARPFLPLPAEETPTSMHGLYNYMTLLQLGHVGNAYESPSIPGLLLRPPALSEDGSALLLAGGKNALRNQPLYRLYDEQEAERVKFAGALDITVGDVLLVWTLHVLLRHYEQALAFVRDRLGEVKLTAPQAAAEEIGSLQSDLFALSRDVVPLSLGLTRLAEHSRAFRWRNGQFLRTFAAPTEGSGEPAEAPAERRSGFVERVKGLVARLQPREARPEELEPPPPPVQKTDLLENVRLSVAIRSSSLQNTEEDLRKVTSAIGSMVYAVVQERAGRRNLQLQSAAVIIALVVTLLTVVTTINSCEPTQSDVPGQQQTTSSEAR